MRLSLKQITPNPNNGNINLIEPAILKSVVFSDTRKCLSSSYQNVQLTYSYLHSVHSSIKTQ